MPYNLGQAASRAAELAASFANGNVRPVAEALGEMNPADATAVALLMSAHLTPAKRAMLADLILGG